MRRLLLLAVCAAAAAGPTDELLFKARHAHQVRDDLPEAIRLYRKALRDKSLDRARQAEVHLRIALCYEEIEDFGQALDHLTPHMFKDAGAATRRLAGDARRRIEARVPRVKEAKKPAQPDPGVLRAELFAEHLRQARRFLESGDEMRALWHSQWALKIDPQNAEAHAIDAELESRLSGMAHFVRDPLKFVRTWTETRVAQVARTAEGHLTQAVGHAEKKEYNLAVASFRQAVRVIDACEFGRESDRLVVLRHRVVARWETLLREELGKSGPDIPEAPRSNRLLGEYLNTMQRMLDLVSAPDREYRIVPVRAPRGAPAAGWRRKPLDYGLLRDIPSTWSPALFARLYLPLRVHSDSWAQRGNYLDAVGGMLVARNRPKVLDAVQEEVRRLEQPVRATLRGRFLLVPVARGTLEKLEQELGEFRLSHRGKEAIQFRVVPPRFRLDSLCSYLRDHGAEVRPEQDTFEVEITNGVPQTFFAAVPLSRAPGYESFDTTRGPAAAMNYGLLIDVYPLQDRTGGTAIGMRLTSRLPMPPLKTRGKPAAPRFLAQETELFVDLPRGATLCVAGLVDPFAARENGASEMLFLWENSGEAAAPPAGAAQPLRAEVPLRNLLLKQRDDPGPRSDTAHGFLKRGSLDVLAGRAGFLQALLRAELGSDEATVHVEEAVLRVPSTLRDDAAGIVSLLERESERSYVIRIHTRAVRTSVLERWLKREELKLKPFDSANLALADPPSGEFLLRNLEPSERGDVFAPRWDWPKPTALGLQARHVFSARTRTSPAYRTEDDLATTETRTITEGLRVTVRPYTSQRNTLRALIDIETVALESEVEERALALAVPSYRTRVSGTHVAGTIDLGNPAHPKTALICRIPHPTLSRPDRLIEIVVAVSIRRTP